MTEKDAHEQQHAIGPGAVLGITLVGFIIALNTSFGINDYFSGTLILIATILIFLRVYDLRVGLRQFSADLFRKDTSMHRFLSKEKSIIQFVLAALFSVSLAFGMAIILKTLTIVHSGFVVLSIFIITCFSMKFFSSKDLVSGEMKSTVRNKKNGYLLQSFARIISCFLILNTSLVVFLTAHDTHLFYNNEIGFSGFHELAESRAMPDRPYNDITRPLLNLSIIFDAFRSSAVNELMAAHEMNRGPMTYFMFFVIMMMMNFVKFIPFSLGAVLVYFSLRVRYLERINLAFETVYRFLIWGLKKVKFAKPKKSTSQEESHEGH